MVPYYEDDAVQIFHGDCREILPDLPKVDLVLTDPPYGIGKDGQRRTTGNHGAGRRGHEYLGWDKWRPKKKLLFTVINAGEVAIVWGGNHLSERLPLGGKWLVWDKGQRIHQSDGELAWTTIPGALRIYTCNRFALMFDGASHPTQKPLKLMKWCIELCPGNPQTILDPFMGSGTTLRAAKDLGRKAIGIEIEEKYCEIAAQCMAQEVLDL